MAGRARIVTMLAAVLTLSACAWTQAGGNAARTGDAPLAQTLTPVNASQAVLRWYGDSNPPFGDVAIANGFVYATNVNGLQAWDIDHPNCSGSPQHCWPTWTASYGSTPSPPVLGEHYVFFASATPTTWRLYAIDPLGKRNCTTGAFPTCTPVWTGEFNRRAIPTGPPQLTAADNKVYVQTFDNDTHASRVTAFDEAGCGAAATQVCTPAFVTSDAGQGSEQLPAVAGGRLFVSYPDGIRVYDSAGISGCTARTCSPLYSLLGTGEHGAAVTDGRVFTTAGKQLMVFDAAGHQGCTGSPTTCQPLWTAALDLDSGGESPIVTADRVLVYESGYDATLMNERGLIEGFDRSGHTQCSGTPLVCTPTYVVGVGPYAHAIAAGGLLVVSETSSSLPPFPSIFSLKMFDLSGSASCSGAPTRCTPLADLSLGGYLSAAALRPAVGNGVIVVPTVYAAGFFVVGLP